ncbi:hypothetical protein [Spirosoma fluviale]|uniref:Uncharacterized protein n=1 Tax=Spirosoma fluviale TaxID=1597977 RepID=A0A286GX52_9BACT|nr:hypothetical protein [Spirosoma fluviale]SOD99746.1 hypothetical protein SAMN06269250_0142 [Spirosoma fluviale]
MGLFTIPEIEYFHEVQGRTYHAGVLEDELLGHVLSDGVWEKTKQWAKSVQRSEIGFEVSFRKSWQKSGWDNGRVAQIKPYTWARVFKPGDDGKGIYFTIGVDAGSQSLLIKIHYQEQAREQAKALLTPLQRQLCERLIKSADGSYTYCQEIRLQNVEEYSLERLTAETIAFIQKYESTYDLIMRMVWPTLTLPPLPPPGPISFEPGLGPKSTNPNGVLYTKPEQTIQPALIHLQVSLALHRHLSEIYGHQAVSREMHKSNNTLIDMVRQEGDGLLFYEIKTYPSIRTCIREAIGQLLEYSYWTTGQLAKELIIVTPLPADEETRSYMNNLRTTLNLPVWYQQFDLSQNTLSSKV